MPMSSIFFEKLDFFSKKIYNDSIQAIIDKGFGYLKSEIIDALISENEIQQRLRTDFIGRNTVVFDETNSTNIQAKKNFRAADGTVFIAETQTDGRGRLGRVWESQKGAGVWLSVLLKPDIPMSDISKITLVAGLAVCRVLGGAAKIKWPNDIVIGSKKVCGILTEMSAERDKINYVVCGVGINVNTKRFSAELADKATSLFNEYNRVFDRNEIAAEFLNEFELLYKRFLADGLKGILEEYKKRCVTIGSEVRVFLRNDNICGKAVDISEDGAVIVQTENGCVSVGSGEVSIRGMYGYI